MNIEKLCRESINIIKSDWGLPKKGFLAGGSIANIIWELVSGNKAVINDIDIFEFEKLIDIKDVSKSDSLFKYEEKDLQYWEDYTGICSSLYTKEFYSISESKREGIFNTILYQSKSSNPDIIINSFDINATGVGYSIEEDKFYWTKGFEEFLRTGKLKVSNLTTPAHTSIRIVKKSEELNVDLCEFEMNILRHALNANYSDIVKLRFKERYFDMYNKHSDKLNKYFNIDRDTELEDYVLKKYNNKTELFYLKDKELSKGVNILNGYSLFLDKNISNISLSNIFLFYIRNIYGDDKKVEIWSKLNFFFTDVNYFDKEIEMDDINLLERLSKYAPNTIEKLKGLKLSEQIDLIKMVFDKFKKDPIIAISILEKCKLNTDTILDEKTLLLLELSVRKEIVNDTSGKVSKIVKEIKNQDALSDDGFWALVNT